MADEPISTLRVCKHCRIEKPLTEFVRQKGYWMHKCTSCKKAHRRVQYHNREGEYANLDTEAERAKRRESGRQARGRYVWDESWLKKRLIKTCTKCKIELPANPAWFRADTKNTTGLSSWCGSCENRIYWENRASRLEYTRARYRRMAEEEVETLRNWRRRWREANPEKQKASEKRWQEENRELHLKSKIKRQAKRRAQAVSSGGEFTAEDIDAMLAAQKKKCWYCGTKLTAYHVDHRIPLARGGSNGPENLVIACPACNLSKGAKMPWETANPRLL